MLSQLKQAVAASYFTNIALCCTGSGGSAPSRKNSTKSGAGDGNNDVPVAGDAHKLDVEKMRESKLKMQWRTPWHQTEGEQFNMFRTFYSEHNNVNVLKFLQQPIDLRPATIKNWWARRKENETIIKQGFIAERNQTLGDELAAAHFVVFRGGAVKFHGEDKWIKADDSGGYALPDRYRDDMYVQAIDCSDMDLYYEGLINLRNLRNVEWLSLRDCQHLDDWALDRVGNIFADTLVYLDLRGMPLISHRGIGALTKMDKLKILHIDNSYSTEYEMTYLLLEEHNKNLQVHLG